MIALPLDEPPNKYWRMCLNDGLRWIAAKILRNPVARDRGLESDELFQAGYMYMCEKPHTSPMYLQRGLWRCFFPRDLEFTTLGGKEESKESSTVNYLPPDFSMFSEVNQEMLQMMWDNQVYLEHHGNGGTPSWAGTTLTELASLSGIKRGTLKARLERIRRQIKTEGIRPEDIFKREPSYDSC
jgi:hypothetical protein